MLNQQSNHVTISQPIKLQPRRSIPLSLILIAPFIGINVDDVRTGKLDLQDFSAIEHHLYLQMLQFDSAVSTIDFGNLQGDMRGINTLKNNQLTILMSDHSAGQY